MKSEAEDKLFENLFSTACADRDFFKRGGGDNCICQKGMGRGIFLVILLCEINNTKFSRGGGGGGSCPTLSPLLCGINFPWGKGGSGPLSSSSVHEKGMSHNLIKMVMCLNHDVGLR